MGRLGGSQTFRNINRYEEANISDDVIIFRFDAPIYFANVEHFRDSIDKRIEKHGDSLELMILDASAINSIDSTGVHMLTELIVELSKRGVRFYIASAIGPVRDKLKKSGVVELMGRDNYFFDISDALEYYRKSEDVRKEMDFSPLQTNI